MVSLVHQASVIIINDGLHIVASVLTVSSLFRTDLVFMSMIDRFLLLGLSARATS